MGFSRSFKRKFVYKKSKASTYELPADAIAPFHICYYGRLLWEWGDGIPVRDSQKLQDPVKLSKEDILSYFQTQRLRAWGRPLLLNIVLQSQGAFPRPHSTGPSPS